MSTPFAPSARSTVGIEWELMLIDAATGDLVGRGPQVIAAVSAASDPATRFTATAELLTNTVEVTSGVGRDVPQAVGDLADAITGVRRATDPLGVEDVRKVMPLIAALECYLPHLQSLSASSPFWAGERTGYASNRALVFQQLPTAGLPWPLADWTAYESYLDDMVRTGIMADATEVRWDIRPAPRWGTIEVRACDGTPSLDELATMAALVQCLVEHLSRELDAGRALPTLQPWYHRENKWRAARYGLDAHLIVDRAGVERPVPAHIEETLDELLPIATELGCRSELEGVHTTLARGASYQRQLRVADDAGGELRAVAAHLVAEFRAGLRGGGG